MKGRSIMEVTKIKIHQGESKREILRRISEEIPTAQICMTKSVVEKLVNESYMGFEGTENSYSLELKWFENELTQMITIRNTDTPNDYRVNLLMFDGKVMYQDSSFRYVIFDMDS